MRLPAVAQSACVPPTVSVKVSQLIPSTHELSPFAAPVPVAVPSQARGDPVGVSGVDALFGGFADRDLVVESASTTKTMLAIKKSVPMVARALNELGFVFINNAFRVFEFVVEKESLSESDGFRFRMPPRRKSQE
jgi:hypothetical protein